MLACAAAGLQLAGVSALAEVLGNVSELKPGTRMFAYLFSPERMSDLHGVGRHWDQKLGLQQDCRGRIGVKPLDLTLVKPIDLPEGGAHPVQGAWTYRFAYDRCGETKIYNAILLAKNGERPDVTPFFPGSTKASLKLFADAMPAVQLMAGGKLRKQVGTGNCGELQLFDMRVIKQPDAASNGAWQESWTFRRCGKTVDIDVTFTPDGKGNTTYFASGN
jgi:hypothetical protein